VRSDALEQSVEGAIDFDRLGAAGQIVFGGVRKRRRCASDAGEPVDAAGAGKRMRNLVDARQRGFRRTLCPAPTVIRKDAGVGLKASQETLARRRKNALDGNVAAQFCREPQRIERFCDHAGGAQRPKTLMFAPLGARREEDDRDRRGAPVRAQSPQHRRAIHVGHHDVEQNEIGSPGHGRSERLRA